jgi:hypothetical protein
MRWFTDLKNRFLRENEPPGHSKVPPDPSLLGDFLAVQILGHHFNISDSQFDGYVSGLAKDLLN